MFQHTKKLSAAIEAGELTTSCTRDEGPIHWAITDTHYDGTIIVLIVTVTIEYIKINLLYINMFLCK